jgi:hypothetical protein
LLLSLLELLHLDRKLLVLFAASLMPACIIPVGPEWQDPPGEANLAPQIIDWDPFIGTEYAPSMDTAKFSITVTDPNDDKLFFKWIANYSEPGLRRILNARPDVPPTGNGSPQPAIEETFDCNDLNRLPSRNSILVVVADRPFIDAGDPIAVQADGKRAFAAWTLNLSCMFQ